LAVPCAQVEKDLFASDLIHIRYIGFYRNAGLLEQQAQVKGVARRPTQRSNVGHAQIGTFFGSRAPISRAKI